MQNKIKILHVVPTLKRDGAEVQLSKIFTMVRKQLIKQGYIGEIFTFVDASHLIAKANLWKERDKAIEKKYEKLNNEVLPKVSYDKEARIGCNSFYSKNIFQNLTINKITVQTIFILQNTYNAQQEKVETKIFPRENVSVDFEASVHRSRKDRITLLSIDTNRDVASLPITSVGKNRGRVLFSGRDVRSHLCHSHS